MMHSRRWCVGAVRDAEELAHKLTESTWTLCTGFQLGEYVFLNDSTSEDGAQEYAVVKRLSATQWVQLESIIFGWCTLERALNHVLRCTCWRDGSVRLSHGSSAAN